MILINYFLTLNNSIQVDVTNKNFLLRRDFRTWPESADARTADHNLSNVWRGSLNCSTWCWAHSDSRFKIEQTNQCLRLLRQCLIILMSNMLSRVIGTVPNLRAPCQGSCLPLIVYSLYNKIKCKTILWIYDMINDVRWCCKKTTLKVLWILIQFCINWEQLNSK